MLKDDTTLEDNKISNENFVVVMVTKVSGSSRSQVHIISVLSMPYVLNAIFMTWAHSHLLLCSPRSPQLVHPRRRSRLQLPALQRALRQASCCCSAWRSHITGLSLMVAQHSEGH